jgi:hypothetical protein
MSIASIGNGNSSTLMEPKKHIKGLHYTMIPSVSQKHSELNQYALRKNLDMMERQQMRHKLRTSAKCVYQKKAQSTFVSVLTSQLDMIYVHIFKYLEGCYLVGPSIDVFKVAYLNRKLCKFVKETYEVSNFHDFAILNAR